MRRHRTGTRLLMALVGCSVLVLYLGLATIAYLALAALWTVALDFETTAAIVVSGALLAGYLSYRLGTTRLLSRLDAVELPRSRVPEFYRRLDRLTDRMGLDEPTVLLARLPTPNAFALGSARNGVVVLDRSLFRLLNADELETLVAHELAHLERHDAFVQTLAYSFFRTIAGLVLLSLAPIVLAVAGIARAVSWIQGRPHAWTQTGFGRTHRWIERAVVFGFLLVTAIVRAHSRRREYAADDRAAAVTGKPLALARALRTLQRVADTRRSPLSPLYVHTSEDDRRERIFSTHPTTDDRIARLVELARENRAENRLRKQ